jgi:deoxyribose-phosphate aldolase
VSPGREDAGFPGAGRARNAGTPLDLSWVRATRVDADRVERRAADLELAGARSGADADDLLVRAVGLMDLTSLAGDDTPETIRRLCAVARAPLGPERAPSRVAAVCVHHAYIETALEGLRGSGIPVAAVSAGFPAGLSPFPLRMAEIRASVEAGAAEIDAVIMRAHVLTGDWRALHEEVRAMRDACAGARLKVILATGELGTLENVARASRVAMSAGADFIKTSTGKEAVNATLPVGLVMAEAIRDYHERTGYAVGLKPAGGVRTAEHALRWLRLVEDELGSGWQTAELFRLGVSGLLGSVAAALERHGIPPERG